MHPVSTHNTSTCNSKVIFVFLFILIACNLTNLGSEFKVFRSPKDPQKQGVVQGMRSEYAPVMIPWFGVHYYKLNNRNNARISSSSSNSNHCNNNNNVSDNFTRGRSNMRPQLNISSSCTKSRVTSARRTFHQVKEGKNVAQKLLFFTPGGLFLLLFVLVPLGTDALNCYQCYSNSLDPCSYEDYRPCPGLHNRCAIRTRRVHTGELFVKRECSLGCGDGIDTWSTRDLNVSLALSLSLSLSRSLTSTSNSTQLFVCTFCYSRYSIASCVCVTFYINSMIDVKVGLIEMDSLLFFFLLLLHFVSLSFSFT